MEKEKTFIPDELYKPFFQIDFGTVKIIQFSSHFHVKALFVLCDSP